MLARCDIYARVGHDVATSQSLAVDVKDGQLTLDFVALGLVGDPARGI